MGGLQGDCTAWVTLQLAQRFLKNHKGRMIRAGFFMGGLGHGFDKKKKKQMH